MGIEDGNQARDGTNHEVPLGLSTAKRNIRFAGFQRTEGQFTTAWPGQTGPPVKNRPP